MRNSVLGLAGLATALSLEKIAALGSIAVSVCTTIFMALKIADHFARQRRDRARASRAPDPDAPRP